ncbi:MAG: tetratricopeptide repeat protein [Myxococcota bacterium]
MSMFRSARWMLFPLKTPVATVGLALLLGTPLVSGCAMIEDMTGISLTTPANPDAIVAEAMDKLKEGDLPGAMAEYTSLVEQNPDVVEAKIGLSYTQMLAGDFDGADSTLAKAIETKDLPPETVAELTLRRALVALRTGDVENTQKYGEASGLAAGQILAAEVYLADAEADSARPLLEQAASSGTGTVKAAAQSYLEALDDEESGRAQLAEASALWALGRRAEACEAAEELLRLLPPELESRDEMLLLWAGRAVTSGQAGGAEGLLDEMGQAPEGQAWRVQATRALIAVANEDYDGARETLAALGSAGAPADGLVDAIATAAAISNDSEFAREIGKGVESSAIARGLMAAGADDAAKAAAPSSSMLARYLENK